MFSFAGGPNPFAKSLRIMVESDVEAELFIGRNAEFRGACYPKYYNRVKSCDYLDG
jgi:hypothetical protein